MFQNGQFKETDTYGINLYTAIDFDPTAENKAAAEIGATQVAGVNGYTQDLKNLENVQVITVNTANSSFDADDVTWIPTGGSIVATHAKIFNKTLAGLPPVAMINFDGTVTATEGIPFVIQWHPDGIFVSRAPV